MYVDRFEAAAGIAEPDYDTNSGPTIRVTPALIMKQLMARRQTSHWLGLDVHDVGLYREEGVPVPLAPGMVLTVEPGLYLPAGDADLPAIKVSCNRPGN